MSYSEDDYLLLSGIQHFAFCQRQWALIHIEEQWQENLLTVEGDIIHEKAHNDNIVEKRGSLFITHGMHIASRELGIVGVCDVVEFHENENGIKIFKHKGNFQPLPVEYKRGKPKTGNCDELQLCAQAMCLEEMLACEIYEGYLFYNEINHRVKVEFSEELRSDVWKITGQMHELYKRQYTPKVKTGSFCRSCSINELCLPDLCKNINVKDYIERMLRDQL